MRGLRQLLLLFALAIGLPAMVSAQPAGQPQPHQPVGGGQAQPAPGGDPQPTRSFVGDGVLIVLLMGGALFAICRSSNRS